MADAFDKNETEYMEIALLEARRAAEAGDIPVGAVIVDGSGKIIAQRYNEREAAGSAASHAELLCIQDACKKKGSWRLSDCTMYVTLEPCPMCAGAIFNSRIGRVVCGAKNPKAGALGSVLDLNSYPLNHKCAVRFGALEKECSALLSDFFVDKRR